ncbi:MAG: hypothetical protein Q4E17_06650, partial [Synergistes sp.]|nr:hypothetical protein [Synergistes sp.]
MKHSTQAMLNILRVPNQHETYMSRVKDVVRKAAALFVFAMFVACAASPAMAAGLMKITEIQGRGGASSGDMTAKSPDRTIYFGNYWQNPAEDYNPTGTWGDPEDFDAAHWKKEGILWRVLANNTDPGDGSTGVLLLSDQGLYADKFNPRGSNDNKWVSSDIRETLTGLDKQEASTGKAYDQLKEQSFAHDAFNPKEYAAIANTTHIAGGTYAG